MNTYEALSLRIPETGRPRVVIIGGGFAGITLAKSLKGKGFQVVLFDKHNYHTFAPLLYQVASAGLEADSVSSSLRGMFERYEDYHVRMVRVQRVDPESNEVVTSLGRLSYTFLVIANGTKANFFGMEDIEQHSFPLKDVPQALNMRNQILMSCEKASMTEDPEKRRELLRFVVVGGGPTGVEMAGALADLKANVLPKDFPNVHPDEMDIILVEGVDRLLPGMSEYAGQRAQADLEKMGVRVSLNTMVESYDGYTVRFEEGETLATQTLIWGAGVQASILPGLTEEDVKEGSVHVNAYNRVPRYENVFAIGDVAYQTSDEFPEGLPGVAPVAIQQGQHLAVNLVRLANGRVPLDFRYLNKGHLATIGRNTGVADLPGDLHFGGITAWLLWLGVHIFYLAGFSNKLVTFSNWTWNYLTYDRANRIIIPRFAQEDDVEKDRLVLENELT